jgi:hypothetical protein
VPAPAPAVHCPSRPACCWWGLLCWGLIGCLPAYSLILIASPSSVLPHPVALPPPSPVFFFPRSPPPGRCVVTESHYPKGEDFAIADAVFDCIGEAGEERFSLHDLTTPGLAVDACCRRLACLACCAAVLCCCAGCCASCAVLPALPACAACLLKCQPSAPTAPL